MAKIKKILEDYLEEKRSAFPRFFFLDNEDLLYCLSHVPHLQSLITN